MVSINDLKFVDGGCATPNGYILSDEEGHAINVQMEQDIEMIRQQKKAELQQAIAASEYDCDAIRPFFDKFIASDLMRRICLASLSRDMDVEQYMNMLLSFDQS